jgi:hypothetical protein
LQAENAEPRSGPASDITNIHDLDSVRWCTARGHIPLLNWSRVHPRRKRWAWWKHRGRPKVMTSKSGGAAVLGSTRTAARPIREAGSRQSATLQGVSARSGLTGAVMVTMAS